MAKSKANHLNGKILSEKEIEKLLEKAADLLEQGEFEEAEAIAEKLVANGVYEGYDLLAIIYAGSERFEEAIEVLTEALNKNKEDAHLYSALGNCYMQINELEKAREAHNSAYNYFSPDMKVIAEVNLTALYIMTEEYEKVEELYEKHKNSDYKIEFASLYLLSKVNQEQFDKVFEFEKTELVKIEKGTQRDDTGINLGSVYIAIATAYIETKNTDKAHIEKLLKLAVSEDRTNQEIIDVFREYYAIPANNSKYFTVSVEGEFLPEGEEEPAVFNAEYEVVADNIKDAEALIRSYEVKEVINFSILESTSEKTDEKFKGIYSASDLYFEGEFDDEDEF